MNRCSNSHGNSVSPCSCGWFPSSAATNTFSMLFSSMPNHYHNQPFDEVTDHHHAYPSPSSTVDCTLSLGTPSTRHIDYDKSINHNRSKSSLCWDLFQSNNKKTSSSHKSTTGRGGNTSTSTTVLNNLNGDPLLARRCANCDTTSTPLWRNGPRGPKSLCNACGIRYKKEERRATNNATANAGTLLDQQHHHHYSSWAPHHSIQNTLQRVPSNISSGSIGNEFRFIEDDDHRSSDTSIPFLSWHLNVPDNRHSSLVHDYT